MKLSPFGARGRKMSHPACHPYAIQHPSTQVFNHRIAFHYIQVKHVIFNTYILLKYTIKLERKQ